MIIADTGFWLALISQRDAHHARATEVLRRLEEPLITTWPVLTEATHLLATRVSGEAVRRLLRGATEGAFEVFPLTVAHVPRLLELLQRFEDLPMDLADASLVVLAEHLGSGRILSTDQRDFGVYRWKAQHPFQNLLEAPDRPRAAPPPRPRARRR